MKANERNLSVWKVSLRLLLSAALILQPSAPWVGVSSAQTMDVPAQISFQGRLTDDLANPLAGPHDFVFAIFPTSTGGAALWTETRNSVAVTNGAINLQLGAVTPIPASAFELDAAYLQITVDGSPLSPRERLVAVPYAFHSRLLQGRAYDAFVSTDAAVQSILGQKTFQRQLTVSSDVYISAGDLNVRGNRLTTGAGLLDATKLAGAITATQVSASGVQAGTLGASVIASSVAVLTIDSLQIRDGAVTDSKIAGMSASKLIGGLPAGSVDLSTVTTALAGKLSATGDGSQLTGITGAQISGNISGNAANITGDLSTAQIDLSTVTTALAGKQDANAHLDDLADGTLTGSKVGSGVPAANVAAGALGTGVTITPGGVDLSTVTTALAGKLSAAGDGSQLTGITGSQISGNISGNAANITGNLSTAQIDLSTITTALAGKQDLNAHLTDLADGTLAGSKVGSGVPAANIAAGALAAGVTITPGGVDLSTVSTALAGKLSAAGDGSQLTGITGGQITGNIGGNAANITGNLSTAQIDLSTITTALSGKQDLNSHLTDLADGSLTGSKVGAGVPAANIAAGSLGSSVIASSVAVGAVENASIVSMSASKLTGDLPALDGSALTGITASNVAASGVQPGALAAGVNITPGGVDLSTVTTALADKVAKAGDFMSGQLTTESTVTVKGGGFSVAGATLAVASGRVGVGTAFPAGRLEVVSDQTAGTNQVVARFRLTSGGSNVDIVNNDGSGNTAVITEAVYGATDNSAASLVLGGTDANAASHRLDVNRDYTDLGRLNGTSFLRVDNSGNLGIGTTAPGTKLDVAGDAQFGSGAAKSTFSASGALTFPASYSPANPLEAATKAYVDSSLPGSSGWTESGAVVRLTDAADNVVVQSTLTVQGTAFSVGGSTLVVAAGRVGLGTQPGEALHIQSGNVLLQSSGEREIRMLRTDLANNPTFRQGRIILAGDGSPEYRFLYSDDVTPERSVFEFDEKGIVASVKPAVGSHFEGFISGEVNPLFRLNSFPAMQLEMGPGGATPTDVFLRRSGAAAFSLLTGGTERVRVAEGVVVKSTLTIEGDAFSVGGSTLVAASGRVGVGTTGPGSLLHVHGTLVQAWGSGLQLTREGGGDARINVINDGMMLRDFTGGTRAFDFRNSADSSLLTVLSNGKAGIGTTLPATRLDVAGDAQFGSGPSKSTFSASGALTFPASYSPANPLEAATKAYVDSSLPGSSGWTESGAVVALTDPADNVVVQSTLTVQGSAFSVGGATFVVSGGFVGAGTASPAATLHVSSAVGAGTAPVLIVSSGSAASQELLSARSDGRVEFAGPLLRRGSNAYGTKAQTHVNLGSGATTGSTFVDYGYATVGGGQNNEARTDFATVGGGYNNSASGLYSAVGGGQSNLASGTIAAVGGGDANTASGNRSTVSGGQSNKASGPYSAVPGGANNTASGDSSFAAGNRAKASAQGSFVWADSQAADLLGTATDQFLLRAQGGFHAMASSASFSGPGGTLFTVDASSAHFRVPVYDQSGVLLGGGSGWTESGAVVHLTDAADNVVVQSTLSVQGGAFSVAGSALAVASGKMGVGTASPAAALHVSSGASSATEPILIVSTGTAAGQELLRVRKDGNVGIGTDAPARRLEVAAGGADSAFLRVSGGLGGGGAYLELKKGSAGSSHTLDFLNYNGSWMGAFGMNPSGNYVFYDSSFNVPLFINLGTRNVGVNDTTAYSTMTVGGAVGFTGIKEPGGAAAGRGILYFDSASSKFRVSENGGGYSDLVQTAAPSGWTEDGAVVRLSDAADNAVVQSTLTVQGNAFSVGGSTLVVSSGRLGLGTGAPGNRLQIVGGPTALSDFIRLSPDGSAGAQGVGIGIQIEAQPTAQTTPFAAGRIYGLFDANGFGSERLTLQSAIGGVLTDTLSLKGGRVGIDTTAPAADLQVGAHDASLAGSYVVGNSPVLFQSLNNNGGSAPAAGEPALVLARAGVAGQSYSNYAAFELKRYENVGTDSRTQLDVRLTHAVPEAAPAAIMSVRSDGSVGVGTTAPAAALHVSSANAGSGATPLLVSSGAAAGQELLAVKGDGATTVRGRLAAGGAHAAGSQPGDLTAARAASEGALYLGSDGNHYLYFAGSEYILNSGSLNVGGGSYPAEAAVRADSVLAQNSSFRLRSAGVDRIALYRPAATNDFRLWTDGKGDVLSVLNASGNVGVGTNSPSSSMTVAGSLGWIKSGAPAVSPANEARIFMDSADNKLKVSVNGGGYTELDVNGADDASAGGWAKTGSVVALGDAGDSAVVQSTLTVQGNAFSVGGSTLSVVYGKVGLGTSAPSKRLHIMGSGDGDSAVMVSRSGGGSGFLEMSAGDQLNLQTLGHSYPLRVGNDWAFFTTAGRVGLGTTDPAAKLDVAGDAQFGSGASKSTFTAAGNLQLVSGSTVTSAGTLSISTAASAALSVTPALVINAANHVGIGAAGPAARLHVAGGVGEGPEVARFDFGDDSYQYLQLRKTVGTTERWNLGFTSTLPHLTFVQGAADGSGTERMRLTTSGDLGVGATGPRGRLEVRPSAASDYSVYVSSQDAAAVMVVDKLGFLGLGTSAPSARFHLRESGTAAYARVQGGSDGDNFGALELWSDDATPRKWQFAHKSIAGQSYDFHVTHYDGAGWSTPMAVRTTGRVGIGTTAPQARLHVSSGSAAATDSVLVVSSGTGTGQELLVVKGDGKAGVGTASPGYRLDVQSGDVNTSGVYRKGGVSGASASCSAGQVLKGATLSGGILTGGACASDDTGGSDVNDDPSSGMISQSGLVLGGGFPGCVVDDVLGSCWHTDTSVAGSYMRFDLGSGSALEYTKVRINAASAGYAGSYSIQYSDDDTAWSNASTAFIPSASGWNERAWSSVGAHRYWRLLLANTPGAGAWLQEVELYRAPSSGWTDSVSTDALYPSSISRKVGIGTASPAADLDLDRGAAANAWIRLGGENATASKYVGLESGGSGFGANSGFSGVEFGPPSGTGEGYLAFHTHDAGVSSGERMRIDKSGNVGIGTANPSAKLHVGNGSTTNADVGAIFLQSGNGAGGARDWKLYSVGAGNFGIRDMGFNNSGGGMAADALSIEYNTGNVGIGATSPASKLHVFDGDIRISTGAGQPSKGIIFQDGSVQTTAAGSSQWTTNGTHISNANAGSVGVGTASPAARLHLSSGTLLIDGDAQTPFRVGGSTLVVYAGNVGIGNAFPFYAFDLYSAGGAIANLKGGGDTYNFAGINLWSDEATDKYWALMHRKGAGELNNLLLEEFDGATYRQRMVLKPDGTVSFNNSGAKTQLELQGVGDTFNYTSTIYWNNDWTRYWALMHRKEAGAVSRFYIEEFDGSNYNVRLAIKPGGNVGIGTTDPAASRLAVQGSAAEEYHLRVSSQDASGNILAVAKTGYVGIGTSNPARQLHVEAGGNGSILLEGNTTAGEKGVRLHYRDDAPAEGGAYIDFVGKELHIRGTEQGGDGAAELVYISTVGKVGIGTVSPGAKVDVVQGAAGAIGVRVMMPAGAENTQAGVRVHGYSPAIELMDKDNVQNWYMGIDDNDANKLLIGRGYGPGQGVAQAITIDPTGDKVGVGTASPAVKLDVAGALRSQNVRLQSTPADVTGVTTTETTLGSVTGTFNGLPVFLHADFTIDNAAATWCNMTTRIRLDNATTGAIVRGKTCTSNGNSGVGSFSCTMMIQHTPSAGSHTYYLTGLGQSACAANFRQINLGAYELAMQ